VREYETTVIIQPEISDEGVQEFCGRLDAIVEKGGGVRLMYDDQGRRRLAYEIRNFQKGRHLMLHFLDEGGAVPILERVLRLEDSVLRFLTVQVNDNVVDVDARKIRAAEEVRIRQQRAAERAAREAEEASERAEREAEEAAARAEREAKEAVARAEREAGAEETVDLDDLGEEGATADEAADLAEDEAADFAEDEAADLAADDEGGAEDGDERAEREA
jgi:small subunit ribosomal protein S6